MIVLYPTLLAIAAAMLLRRRRTHPTGGAGWRWFAAWTAAGALFTFSLLAGLSIGLFFLPLAAALLLTVARLAPRPPEALGFVAGIGLTLLLVADRNADYNPTPWLLAGSAFTSAALLLYAIVRAR